MESTRTITVFYTVFEFELGPFKHLMKETGFSEGNCYIKCLNGGGGGGSAEISISY